LGDAFMGNENVRWFQVAVNQSRNAAAGVLHTERDVQAEFERLGEIKPLVFDPTPQVRTESFRATDVFEDDVGPSGNLFNQPRLNDITVLFDHDPGGRFLVKAGNRALIVQKATLECLDGYRLVSLMIVAQVNDPHAAPPNVRYFVAILNQIA